ncbi:putative reverse transcriptase domain-containing protein [Tanacetum coccineum]
MLTMDFSNAFNLVDRSALLHKVRVKCPSISLWFDFLYGQALRLYIGDTHIWSATEQQGNPLGPLLFVLILHWLLHKIKDSCKIILHAWYLDDGTVIGDSEDVARVLDIIKVSGPDLGIEPNIKKTKIFWPSCNGMKLREGLFHVDILRSSSGVKLLRRAVSRDACFISGLAIRRAANAVLQDHISYDSGIYGMDDDYVYALACRRDTISSFDFSEFNNKDTVPSKAQQTLVSVLFSEMVKDLEAHFDKTMRQKAVFECLRPPHVQDFLLAIPIDRLGQYMSSVEYYTIFKEHVVHCKELSGFKYRHNMVMHVLFDICRRVEISAKKEALRETCVDLMGVSSLVGLSSRGFTAGQVALKAASWKGRDDFLKEGATCNTNIKKCLRKVTDGHFTTAVKVLPSSGVAPYCDDTIKALEVKHPYKPHPSMPSITFFEPPLVVEIDSVFGCIKFFPKGTSCERDGSRAQHILDALCEEGSATATDLLKFVASAPLTPLFKPDNEIRPIAVGTIWRRLVSKLAMKGVGKEMSKYLSDFQYVVGLSGGTEVVLHSVNSVLSEYHNDESLAMLNVDFSNAFNLVDRSASLYETVTGYSEEVASVLDIIKESGPGLGLELNIKKTKICWRSYNGLKLRED